MRNLLVNNTAKSFGCTTTIINKTGYQRGLQDGR